MADKRFEISVSMDIKERKGDELVPYADSALNYHDAPYDAVLAVEQALHKAEEGLIELGYGHAEKKGLPTPPGHGRGHGRG